MTQLLLLLLLAGLPTTDMVNASSTNTEHYTYYRRGGSQDAQPVTEGGFVLMGGGGDVDEAFQWMAERGGNGDFLVLRGSGGDGYQQYLDEITDANSVETLVIKDREGACDPFVLERVARAEMIFLAGGDQFNYVGKWKGTPLLDALNGAILKGVPIGGTSAGLAVLGQHLFTAEKGTITPQEALANPYHERLLLDSSFLKAAPLQGVITDSHFSERDRMGRLVSFMARLRQQQPDAEIRGVGVDEATAALLTPDGQSRVVGRGGVHWVRSEGPPQVCQPELPLTFEGLSVTSVGQGENFDLNRWSSPQQNPRPLSAVAGSLR
jgi:cyanophycinase